MNTETQFTPGPWITRWNNSGTAKQIRDNSQSFPIGEIYFGDKLLIEENEANGRLIAAAPDMYAALTDIISRGLELPHDFTEQVRAIIDQINNTPQP